MTEQPPEEKKIPQADGKQPKSSAPADNPTAAADSSPKARRSAPEPERTQGKPHRSSDTRKKTPGFPRLPKGYLLPTLLVVVVGVFFASFMLYRPQISGLLPSFLSLSGVRIAQEWTRELRKSEEPVVAPVVALPSETGKAQQSASASRQANSSHPQQPKTNTDTTSDMPEEGGSRGYTQTSSSTKQLAFLRTQASSLAEEVRSLHAQASSLTEQTRHAQTETSSLRERMHETFAHLQRSQQDSQQRIATMETQFLSLSDSQTEEHFASAALGLSLLSQLRAMIAKQENIESHISLLRRFLALATRIPLRKRQQWQEQLHELTSPPSLSELQDSFSDLAMSSLAGDESQGWRSSLRKVLGDTFSLRPTGMIEGDTTEAHIARAEVHIEAGRVAAAIQELGQLSAAPADVWTTWLNRARARVAALQTISELEQDMMHQALAVQTPARQPTSGLSVE